jgi:tetratricopeptide (TPR) repeat protein
MPNRPGVSAFFMTEGYGADADQSHRIGDRWYDSIKLVQQTFLDLGALVEDPQVGAEARLRRGILEFHRANPAESLDELRHATKTSDPDLAYVAHVYTGLALDGLNRRTDAIDAFEAALRVVPHAPSAVMALAADLFLADRRAEASARLEEAFARPAPLDPWRRFSLGDYRFWPAYLIQLREALTR